MSDANPRFELVPLDPELAGPFAFDGEKPLRIGRDPESEIVLPYPSVSRRHAQIRFEEDRCLLLDVGSRHGTYLNGQQIETGTVVQVGHGDRLAFPPHDYRVQLAGGEDVGDGAIVELDDASGDDGQVEQISNRELNQLAARRLELLMDRAGAISEARDQEELVECVLEILLDGTGFARAAILRPIDEDDRIEVVGVLGRASDDPPFSRTLIAGARTGKTVRLSSEQDLSEAVSIVAGGVQSAICTPVRSGAVIDCLLYLDATDSSADAADDAAYCAAIARLHGLALGNLQRKELERRQESLEQEIQAARSVQERIMPAPDGEVGNVRYSMHARPGRVVAGDLFGFTNVPDGRIAFFLGDVAGKGAAAGMLMAVIQASLAAYFNANEVPSAAIDRLNDFIESRTAANEFSTLFLAEIDTSTGRLRTVDAGHGYALLIRGGESTVIESDGGPPVGAVRGIPFGMTEHELRVGDRIVLYSDGVAEEPDSTGEQFGVERTQTALRGSVTVAEDVERVMNALREFAGGEAYSDDVTVASLEITAIG